MSMNEIIEKLNSILTDTVVLKLDLSIEALSLDLEVLLEFSTEELTTKSFSIICEDPLILDKIKMEIQKGYFDNITTNVIKRNGERLKVMLSGFYLGLISDINGYIIMKIRSVENSSFLKKALTSKKHELDSFIYRTAHDLRGPLATIKGLVNLLKIREDNFEVDDLTSLIEIHANKLDDRLFKLLYLSDVDSSNDDLAGVIKFGELEDALRKVLEANCYLPEARFEIKAPEEVRGANERDVRELIASVLLYIISLPMISVDEITIIIEVEVQQKSMEMRITSNGFLASESVQKALDNPTFLYDDLLTNPYLFNYYVAQKRAGRLDASLRIDFQDGKKQILSVSVPLKGTIGENVKSKSGHLA